MKIESWRVGVKRNYCKTWQSKTSASKKKWKEFSQWKKKFLMWKKCSKKIISIERLLRYLAARNFMLSGTDNKTALFPRMTKANHDELEAFMLPFYHNHYGLIHYGRFWDILSGNCMDVKTSQMEFFYLPNHH